MKYLAHSSCLSLFLKPMLWNLLVVFKWAVPLGYSSFEGYFTSATHLFSHSLCHQVEIGIELFEGEITSSGKWKKVSGASGFTTLSHYQWKIPQ